MNLDFMLTDAWVYGALGGSALGIAGSVMNLVGLSPHSPNNRYWQFLFTHLIATLLFALLGAMTAMIFDGKAGSAVTGMSAVTLVSVLAGKAVIDRFSPSISQNAGENQ